MVDVVAELRALAFQIDPCLLGGPDARLLNQAADEIEALRKGAGDEVTGCADDQIFANVDVEVLRGVAESLASPLPAKAEPSYADGYAKAIEDAARVADEIGTNEDAICDSRDDFPPPKSLTNEISAAIRALAGKDEA